MSIILMTTLFYKALILQGEIWCWSLLGLKELSVILTLFQLFELHMLQVKFDFRLEFFNLV